MSRPATRPAALAPFEVEAVLLDIEGTISSISYVADVMMPYARERIATYVAAHAGEAEVARILDDARALDGGARDPVEALLDWAAEDRKAPPLKTLQGLIWAQGFHDGSLCGHIYDDALAALRAWHAAGLPLVVYSSGSVAAQLLFFEFNIGGDLRPLFSAHYDTGVGAKTDAASYARICGERGLTAEKVLFLSDNPAELSAAQAAGLQVVHVARDGISPDRRFAAIADFAEISLAAHPASA